MSSARLYWSIAPSTPQVRVTRRYALGTLILETEFDTADGSVLLTNFLPMDTASRMLIRLVFGLRGRTPLRMHRAPRFD
jgi:hypothetical protein